MDYMKIDHKEYYSDWVFGVIFTIEALFIIALIIGFAIFVAPFMA